jgi:UDP-N-acetylglucosamine acyltransferase
MAQIHPSAVVEEGASLADDVQIGAFAYVGARVRLAEAVQLMPHATVTGATELGPRTIVHSHAVLGGGPQYRGDPGADARLVIGADNVIREHVTMNGGSAKGGGLTRVGDRGYFMAYSHVAHDCRIGDGVTMANGVALGGHVVIDDGVNLGGLSAIQQFCRIGCNAFIGGVSGVPGDVIPYGIVWGDRARLHGLNLVGLKRRGVTRERIHAMRAAYRTIFFGDGVLAERAAAAARRWADIPEIGAIAAFIRSAGKRPIVTPQADDTGGLGE